MAINDPTGGNFPSGLWRTEDPYDLDSCNWNLGIATNDGFIAVEIVPDVEWKITQIYCMIGLDPLGTDDSHLWVSVYDQALTDGGTIDPLTLLGTSALVAHDDVPAGYWETPYTPTAFVFSPPLVLEPAHSYAVVIKSDYNDVPPYTQGLPGYYSALHATLVDWEPNYYMYISNPDGTLYWYDGDVLPIAFQGGGRKRCWWT